jgi:hypothetical protein
MRARLFSPLLLTLALLLAACDGEIFFDGVAYRLADPRPGDKGFILVDEELPSGLALEPLAGVEVTIYHDPEDIHRTDETARRWRTEATSSEDGTFSSGGATAPGGFEAAVGARKQGCTDVSRNFKHGKVDHKVYVVLVCDEAVQRSGLPRPASDSLTP